MSVRKAHNSGRNHLRNVVDYYQQIGHEKAQSVIDSITSSYAAEGQSGNNPMLQQNAGLGMAGGGGGPPGFPPPGFPPGPGGVGGFGGVPSGMFHSTRTWKWGMWCANLWDRYATDATRISTAWRPRYASARFPTTRFPAATEWNAAWIPASRIATAEYALFSASRRDAAWVSTFWHAADAWAGTGWAGESAARDGKWWTARGWAVRGAVRSGLRPNFRVSRSSYLTFGGANHSALVWQHSETGTRGWAVI